MTCSVPFSIAPRRSPAGAERLAVVAQHLFSAKATQGIFLRLDELTDKVLAKAYRDLLKQKAPPETEDEGVLKELQSLGTG